MNRPGLANQLDSGTDKRRLDRLCQACRNGGQVRSYDFAPRGAPVVARLRHDHTALLSRVDLFRGLDRVALAKVAGHLEPVLLPAGAVLFQQGDPGDAFYLISRGTFRAYARASSDGDEVVYQTMRRGDAIGEVALLTGDARTATVRAEEDGEVLRLPTARFLELMRSDPSVGLAISATLIRRLRTADAARLGTELPTSSFGDHEPEELTRAKPPRPSRAGLAALILSAVVFMVGWSAPAPPDLGAPGWHALISLVAVVPVLALEALPDGAIALLLVAIWSVGGVVPPQVALGGFSTTTFVLTVAVFALGAAIAGSGLLYRLALWTVSRVSSMRGQVLTLTVSGLLISPAVPNATGRMALASGAVRELADALGCEPGDATAQGMAMASLIGYGQMSAAFPTSSTVALLAFALLPEASRAAITWAGWAVRAAPLHLILLIGLSALILWRSRAAASNRTRPRMEQSLALQRALLGRISPVEIVAGLATVALLVGFATQPLHRVDPAWVAIAAFVVLAAAGAISVDTLRAINWSTVLLLGVLAGVGTLFTATGLDAWLASTLAGWLGGVVDNRLVFVLAVAGLCLTLSLVLRWQAAVPIIVVALSPIAQSAAIDPWVIAIITLTASNTFFLPYQSTIYRALYDGTGGRLFHHAQARPISIAYALLVLIGLAASVPFWEAMGLL